MTSVTRWWWVRHGPVPDAEGRIMGRIDADCDCTNVLAVNGLAALLPRQATTVISPLLRTRQTLAAIAAAGGVGADPVIEADFIEQSFGEWEGFGWTQMQARDPDYYAQFWIDPTRIAPPGGESFSGQMERTAAAIERLSLRFAGRDIVCVSHGGTIRAACAHALNLAAEIAMAIVIDNLSITRLDRVANGLLQGTGGVWRVHHLNAPAYWTPG